MLDDLELFLRLNEEYAAKPLIPRPPRYNPATLLQRGNSRAQELEQRHQIRGKRVLEFGCGPGETARALASEFGCEVVAVDNNPDLPEQWARFDSTGVDFRVFDVSSQDPSQLGMFDFVYSNATLEHVVHPHALLSAIVKMVVPGGRMHFNMGLHRGTMGSHLYREVLFPWPHLVFTDSTFERFYERIGKPPRRPVWINHITAAQWLEIFDALGLHSEAVWYSSRPIDQSFYDRFEDILSRYPTYDLEKDLMYVDLVKPDERRLLELNEPAHPAGNTLRRRRFDVLKTEIERIEQIALDRLQMIRSANVDRSANVERSMQSVAADLEQKVAHLQQFEERLKRDLRGVRRLGRAISFPGVVLDKVREAIAKPKPESGPSRS